MDDEKDNSIFMSRLLVAVRIRPISQKELGKDNVSMIARTIDDKTILLVDPNEDYSDDILRKDRPKEKLYTFDHVFPESASQIQVFHKTVRFLISYVLQGFNATCFAYGATGAGKTYTMLGTDMSPGVMALTLADLFNKIQSMSQTPKETCTVSMTYLEIYNELIRDLLSGKSEVLDLREDYSHGVVVAGITTVTVSTAEEVMMFLRKGNRNRSQEPTGANEVSSRSHAVLQVTVTFTKQDSFGNRIERHGKLSMIDLAGSERAAETNNRGIRMIEGANINRSLLALGNCINALGETAKKGKYVNYRDSKLTRLLKDSLGGNCRTVMIANISPCSSNFDETINTLKYASRARVIKTKISQQIQCKNDAYSAALSDESIKLKLANALNGLALTKKPPSVQIKNKNSRIGHDDDDKASVFSNKTDYAKNKSNLASDDSLSDAVDALGAIFLEKFKARDKLIEAEDAHAEKSLELERTVSELESLQKLSKENTKTHQAKEIENNIKSLQHEITKIKENQTEILAIKASHSSSLLNLDKKISFTRTNLSKSINSRGIEYIMLLIKSHYLEMENLDLDLNHSLSNSSIMRKNSEIEILYNLIQLYETIIQYQIKERKTPIPNELQVLLDALQKLKEKLNICINENDLQGSSAKIKIKLQALADRIAIRIPASECVISPISKTPRTESAASKNSNAVAKGLSKLWKKPNQTSQKPATIQELNSMANFENILTKNHISPGHLDSISDEEADSKSSKTNLNENFISNNLGSTGHLSKSLQFLEKQVGDLINKPRDEYSEQSKSRNSERATKLNENNMVSDGTLVSRFADQSIKGSSGTLSGSMRSVGRRSGISNMRQSRSKDRIEGLPPLGKQKSDSSIHRRNSKNLSGFIESQDTDTNPNSNGRSALQQTNERIENKSLNQRSKMGPIRNSRN